MSDNYDERPTLMKFSSYIGYHHIVMFLIAIAIVLLSLLLAGCSSSSPLIPGIFLISLYYQKYNPVPSTAQVDFNAHNAIAVVAGDAVLQCRVGYFGICINPDGGSWLCSNNATALANEISLSQDPLNLIWLASQFKDMIVFPYLIIIAILFALLSLILLVTFPNWDKTIDEDEVRYSHPFPTRAVTQVLLALLFVASVFVLVSVLWQHTASVAASIISQDFGNGSVRSGVGTTAMVFGWFGFAILIICIFATVIMVLVSKYMAGEVE